MTDCSNCDTEGTPCYDCSTYPCTCKDAEIECKKTQLCDPRYLTLDRTRRINILGADGKCIKTFCQDAKGFLVADGLGSPHAGKGGQLITNAPIVPIPYLKAFEKGIDGSIVRDEGGNAVEALPPSFDSLLVSLDADGAQRRYQGMPNIEGELKWDGQKWYFISDAEQSTSNAKDVEDTDSVHCRVSEVVTIDEDFEAVVGGKCVTITKRRFARRKKSAIPIGMVTPFAGEVLPEGWQYARGGLFNKNDYPDAFKILGFSFGGSGDQFRVPDMRGRFARGWDPEGDTDKDYGDRYNLYSGGNTGNKVGSYQDDAMQEHGHEGDNQATSYVLNLSSANTTIGEGGGAPGITYLTTDTSLTSTDENISVCEIVKCNGAGLPSPRTSEQETRPKNIAMNFIIFLGCPVS